MRLNAYLKQNRLSCSAFAEKIGVKGETVRRYGKGLRTPRKKIMTLIVLHTGGLVTANDFHNPTSEAGFEQ